MKDYTSAIRRRIDLILSGTGGSVLAVVEQVGFTLIMLGKAVLFMRFAPVKRHEVLKHMHITGIKSLLVCSIVAFFTGMILALQSGIQLKKFNQAELVGNLVISSMTMEMGPFITALIITASVGSAMAAEIGTMKVTEQIDALEMMSISPIKFVVMPRVLALTVMLPAVTIYTVILGTFGGAIIAKYQLGIGYDTYFMRVMESLVFKDMYVGLFKALVFGFIISGISCANGLKTTNGVIGVGETTRRSVVASFLMILIIGYFMTSIFYGGEL